MANTTTSRNSDRSETSVLFNLQELMRIEAERVNDDVAAERAAREALVRQQQERDRIASEVREQALRVDLAAQQQAVAAQAAAETERAAALLSVRLRCEGEERAERMRREAEHARALELIAAQSGGSRTLTQAMVVLSLTCALIAAGYLAIARPMLETMRSREAEAIALVAAHARELAALREPAEKPKVLTSAMLKVTPVDLEQPEPPTNVKTKRRRTGSVPQEQHVVHEPALDGIDSDNDDPLLGLREIRPRR